MSSHAGGSRHGTDRVCRGAGEKLVRTRECYSKEFLTFYANINLQNIDEKIIVAVFYFRGWARLLKIIRKYKKNSEYPEHPNVDIDRV